MREELVTFQVAKLAKEKGFDLKVKNWFDISWYHFDKKNPIEWESSIFVDFNSGKTNQFSRPTQSLLQRWLREVHEINVESNYLPNIQKYSCLHIPMTGKASIKDINYVSKIRFNTYEEALELGLQEALKLIKSSH